MLSVFLEISNELSNDFPSTRTEVSSAKNNIEMCFEADGRSFMYNMNNNGPSMEQYSMIFCFASNLLTNLECSLLLL